MRSITSHIVGTIVAVAGGLAAAQDEVWSIPEQFRTTKNPVAASSEVIEAGKQLYVKHCLRCHGDSGLGDGPATKFIKPAPKDIASAAAQDRLSDGELFYMVTEGKRPMPPMKATLTDEERWQIVHFVRTLRR